MDISDILTSVNHGRPEDSREQSQRDQQALTRAWVNEKGAPELLPWPEELMDRVLRRVRDQITMVEDQASMPDPRTSFRLIIIQTELERWKFLVRSYLRARISKIDAHPLHYLSESTSSTSSPFNRLSASETEYCRAHQALLSAHYSASFLSQFPVALQRIDDTTGGISMVEQPDRDKAVFLRGLIDSEQPVQVPGTDIDFELRKGGVYVVRWSAIKDYVENGEAELI